VLLRERDRVAPVVGLGQGPASDRRALGAAEPLDQSRVSGLLNPGLGEHREPGRDRQPDIPPGQLLVDDGLKPSLLHGSQVRVGRDPSDVEGSVLLENLPEDRARSNHVGRIGHAIELNPRGSQHLLRKPVGGVANGELPIRKPDLYVDDRHRSTLALNCLDPTTALDGASEGHDHLR
jgi:hypothetical protein